MATEFIYIDPAAAKYLAGFKWQRDELLLRLEDEAQKERIPIINLEGIQLLSQLARLKQAQSILEVGTAIAYSTIWLARASSSAKVITLEIDERMVHRANENIAEAKLADRIEVIHRDATLGLPEQYAEQQFDMIFLDASKQKYELYLELYLPHLKSEGLLVVDNVLFHGLVFNPPQERRQAWIAEKLDQFNQILFNHPQLETSILPIGDGISLSIKK